MPRVQCDTLMQPPALHGVANQQLTVLSKLTATAITVALKAQASSASLATY